MTFNQSLTDLYYRLNTFRSMTNRGWVSFTAGVIFPQPQRVSISSKGLCSGLLPSPWDWQCGRAGQLCVHGNDCKMPLSSHRSLNLLDVTEHGQFFFSFFSFFVPHSVRALIGSEIAPGPKHYLYFNSNFFSQVCFDFETTTFHTILCTFSSFQLLCPTDQGKRNLYITPIISPLFHFFLFFECSIWGDNYGMSPHCPVPLSH